MIKIMKHLDPVLVLGTFVSIFLPAWLWFAKVTSIETSTIIALLSAILTLLIDLIVRVEQRNSRDQLYSSLIRDLESVSWLKQPIIDIIMSCKSIFSNERHKCFYSHTKHQVMECKKIIQSIESGCLETDYYDVLPLVSAVESTEKIIRAVSVAALDVDFWNSSAGKKLWAANVSVLGRIKIERIFIVNTKSSEIERIIKNHHDAGVECYVIPGDKVNPSDKKDLIVFDEVLSYHAKTNATGDPYENILSTDEIDIKNNIDTFLKLKSHADRIQQ